MNWITNISLKVCFTHIRPSVCKININIFEWISSITIIFNPIVNIISKKICILSISIIPSMQIKKSWKCDLTKSAHYDNNSVHFIKYLFQKFNTHNHRFAQRFLSRVRSPDRSRDLSRCFIARWPLLRLVAYRSCFERSSRSARPPPPLPLLRSFPRTSRDRSLLLTRSRSLALLPFEKYSPPPLLGAARLGLFLLFDM